jgi:hypothetical protein
MIRRLKRQTKRRHRPRGPNEDSQLYAKIGAVMRPAWDDGWDPSKGYSIRLKRQEPIVLDFHRSDGSRGSIIGAPFSPDVWKP